jgi:outer membrane protein assembly factor BamB
MTVVLNSARRSDYGIKAALLTLVVCWAAWFKAAPCAGDELRKFGRPSIDSGYIGFSVDILQDKVLVGDRLGGYAFLYDGATGEELLRLRGSDVSVNDLFGYDLKLTDQYAFVSAPQGESVYQFDATTGAEIRKFTLPSARAGFGRDIDINGNLLIVGDSVHGSSQAGAALLFNIDSGALVHQFVPPVGSPTFGRFGTSVDLEDKRLLVGAPDVRGNASRDGVVYVYDAVSKARLRTLIADDTDFYSDFGVSVSLDGNLALVGAPGFDSGAAYLFDIETGTMLRKFIPPPALGAFGHKVVLDGNWALIGDRDYYVDGRGYYVGAAFLYDITTGQLVRSFIADDTVTFDHFGIDVDFEGELFVFGSAGDVYYTFVPEPSSFLLTFTLIAVGFPVISPRLRQDLR